ncbi:uncharacterized protein LOC117568606 [Drosophila albomicans]|uniref:Uncharacterized protein LOC117568606 n=1 Tax=Drosophila albomicans TaxID=7291 RepID=A0A6P8X0H8_DROAB|nr:uncharacterized protein LOC117568606 [Drosophila albomicans]
MKELRWRAKDFSEFTFHLPSERVATMRANKLANELLRHSLLSRKYLPKSRLPRYNEFRQLVQAVHGNSSKASEVLSLRVFHSLKELCSEQIKRQNVKHARLTTIQSRLSPEIHRTAVHVRNKYNDLIDMQDIYRKNLLLLNRINAIKRIKGTIDCFNRTPIIATPKRRSLDLKAEALKRENKLIGCRLLTATSKVDSRNSRFHWTEHDRPESNASVDVLEKYSSYMPLPQPNKRLHTDKELLRPVIYFDLAERQKRFLGRICIQLYTEVSPEVVLEFVRLATDNDVQAHKFTHIFPDLWMRGELQPQARDALENHHSRCSTLDARKLKGLLSYSWRHVKRFPKGALVYTITFKKLSVTPLRRVIFGRVLSGMRMLEVCREFGTKGGKPRKPIVVVKCGLL